MPYWEMKNPEHVDKGLTYRLCEHLHSSKVHRLPDEEAKSTASRVRTLYADRSWKDVADPWEDAGHPKAKRRKVVGSEPAKLDSMLAALPTFSKAELARLVQAATEELAK